MLARVVLVIALVALAGCGTGKPFDAAIWKHDSGQSYESARSSMLIDFQRRYPKGSTRSAVIEALGPSEANFPEICREHSSADDCIFYYVGASGVDPIVFVVGFRNGKTDAYWKRTL